VATACRLIRSIASGEPHGATIEDAVIVSELVDAMLASAREGRWKQV
jgi:predicted dehydrogenase